MSKQNCYPKFYYKNFEEMSIRMAKDLKHLGIDEKTQINVTVQQLGAGFIIELKHIIGKQRNSPTSNSALL